MVSLFLTPKYLLKRRLCQYPAIVRVGGDEVSGDWRDTRLLECEGAGFDRLMRYDYTGMLAQVLGP